MIDVIVNPSGIESIYLEYLNTCFPHWGDRDTYRWCFERQIGDLRADLMILKSKGRIIAGSAVTYRPVMLGNIKTNVGIMTGSWTLPNARRQGCFARIIVESLRLTSDKNSALLLAFVTESNASFRRLAAAGSSLFPTHYIFSNDETPTPQPSNDVSPMTDWNQGIERILERLNHRRTNSAYFTYTADEWRSQFLDRQEDIEFLCIDDSLAVVAKKGDFDRILMLSLGEKGSWSECIQSLLKRALDHRRRLFLFTTSSAWKKECMKLGLSHAPGYLTALVANKNVLAQVNPKVPGLPTDMGSLLYKADSPWYLGDWGIQSGDRM